MMGLGGYEWRGNVDGYKWKRRRDEKRDIWVRQGEVVMRGWCKRGKGGGGEKRQRVDG
jgi:hypothetical protein